MSVEQLSTIEKKTVIRAPRARVWKAITESAEFAKWFRVEVRDEFHPGARVPMKSIYPGHEGTEFSVDIEEVVPEKKFSWRWAADDGPPTLVVFALEEVEGGTLVKVTESGFDRISLARRAKAFEENEHGWELQVENLRKYAEEAN